MACGDAALAPDRFRSFPAPATRSGAPRTSRCLHRLRCMRRSCRHRRRSAATSARWLRSNLRSKRPRIRRRANGPRARRAPPSCGPPLSHRPPRAPTPIPRAPTRSPSHSQVGPLPPPALPPAPAPLHRRPRSAPARSARQRRCERATDDLRVAPHATFIAAAAAALGGLRSVRLSVARPATALAFGRHRGAGLCRCVRFRRIRRASAQDPASAALAFTHAGQRARQR